MKTLGIVLGLVFGFSLSANAINPIEPATPILTELIKENETKQDTKTVYVWSVETEYGHAKGVSESLADAEKMVDLTTRNDYKHSIIIETLTLKK